VAMVVTGVVAVVTEEAVLEGLEVIQALPRIPPKAPAPLPCPHRFPLGLRRLSLERPSTKYERTKLGRKEATTLSSEWRDGVMIRPKGLQMLLDSRTN